MENLSDLISDPSNLVCVDSRIRDIAAANFELYRDKILTQDIAVGLLRVLNCDLFFSNGRLIGYGLNGNTYSTTRV